MMHYNVCLDQYPVLSSKDIYPMVYIEGLLKFVACCREA